MNYKHSVLYLSVPLGLLLCSLALFPELAENLQLAHQEQQQFIEWCKSTDGTVKWWDLPYCEFPNGTTVGVGDR